MEDADQKEVILLLQGLREITTSAFLTFNNINLMKMFPFLFETGLCYLETLYTLYDICDIIGNVDYFIYIFDNFPAANWWFVAPDGNLEIIHMGLALRNKLIDKPYTTNQVLTLYGLPNNNNFAFCLNYEPMTLPYIFPELEQEKNLGYKIKEFLLESSSLGEGFLPNFLKLCFDDNSVPDALEKTDINPVICWLYFGLVENLHKHPFHLDIKIYLFVKQIEETVGDEILPKHQQSFTSTIKQIILEKLIFARRLIETRANPDIYNGVSSFRVLF